MISKKHILLICLALVLALFINNLLSGHLLMPDTSETTDLSKIVSEQITRIITLIAETQAESSPYKEMKIQYLENKKNTIIYMWRAEQKDLLLKQLAPDLQIRAAQATVDFATPVLDTRFPS